MHMQFSYPLFSYPYISVIIISINFIGINKCLVNNGGCEHQCVNTEGSYYCTCNEGFQLIDNKHSCEGNIDNEQLTHINQTRSNALPTNFNVDWDANYILVHVKYVLYII